MKRGRTQEASDTAPRKQQKTNSATTATSSSSKQPAERQYKQLKVEDALAYLDQVKLKFKDQPAIYDKFLDIMKDFKAQTYVTHPVKTLYLTHFLSIDTPGVIARVSELFKGHDNLILGFNTFLPPGYKIEMHHFKPQDKKEKERMETVIKNRQQQAIDFDQAISYVTKIKARFNDQPETYKSFLDILHTYQKEQTTIRKVYEQVAILFKDHSDLLTEFTHFLPETPADAKVKPKGKKKGEPITRKKKVNKKKNEEEEEEYNYENRREYSQGNIAKYGPSYRVLPKNYPQPQCSERSELCNEVLNDELVSVPAGSEESRGDAYKKSVFDEIVFQCEDDRTELDIVIEQNISTICFLEPLAAKLESDPNAKFKLDQLRDIHRASIARIYADKANEILEGMRKNPSTAIPVILSRLRQKDEEWKSARKGLNKFWREIYEKNYQKAMEDQCTNFKQSDKKNLGPRNILQDIEERHTYNKELTTQMQDESIHHILYSMLEQVGEITPEELEKAKQLWKDVIIPFFGLHVLDHSYDFSTNNETIETPRQSQLSKLVLTPVQQDPDYQPLVERDLAKTPTKHTFFGNVPLVLFMRYYIFAYERLKKAKELAERQMRNLQKPAVTADIIRTHETLMQGGEKLEDEKKDASSPKSQQDHFTQFLRVMNQYFTDQCDTAVFEEEAKRLLGYQAWIVFTYDKLFANLQRHLQLLFTDETTPDLIRAFKYEFQRVNSFLDNSYFMQAHKIIGPGPCYVLDYNLSKQRLVLDLVEPLAMDREKIDAEEKGLEYIQKYLSTTRNDVEQDGGIFLKRSKKISHPLDNVVIVNNLEYKVCLATFKMFYVEGTSDFFYRKKKTKSSLEALKKRQANFPAWLEKRRNEMAALVEEQPQEPEPQDQVMTEQTVDNQQPQV